MTRNEMNVILNLRRIDICDLLLACTFARARANDGGWKWEILHGKLGQILEDFDKNFDEVEK